MALLAADGGWVVGRADDRHQTRTEPKPLTFEAASIRLGHPAGFWIPRIQTFPGGRLSATNVDLRGLIQYAFGIWDSQWVEGDDPVLGQVFNVEATAGADVERTPSGVVGPLNVMLQALLAERFRLATRWAQRPELVFVLEVAGPGPPRGPGLRPSKCPPRPTTPILRPPPEPTAGASGGPCWDIAITNGVVAARGARLSDFVRILAPNFDRPLVDRTGLAGLFDIDTRFNREDLPRFAGQNLREGRPDAGYPSLYTALRDDLGLTLERRRDTVSILVVDHVESLIEN